MQIVIHTQKPLRNNTVFLVLLVSLILRSIWGLLVPVVPLSDGYAYDVFARNLAHGFGYSWGPGLLTAHWPVGTSFIYSLFYRSFGFTYLPIVFFNICISLVTIWLTMKLANKWFGSRTAMGAGLLLAFWPAQIEFVSVLGSELIFNLLLVTWLFVWDSMRDKPWLGGLSLGVLAAATCYVRPTGLLIPLVLLVLDLVRERPFSYPLLTTTMCLLVACLLIVPWSIRNTRLFGSFVLISTNGGVNFWEGNNPTGDGSTQALPANTATMNEAARDQYLGKLAKQYVREYPARFIMRTLGKSVRLYSHESIGVYWNQAGLESRYGPHIFTPLKIFSSLYWACALALGLGGLLNLVHRRGFIAALFHPVVTIWLYFTAVYGVTVIQDRYHFAVVPCIAILGGSSLAQLYTLKVSRFTTRPASMAQAS